MNADSNKNLVEQLLQEEYIVGEDKSITLAKIQNKLGLQDKLIFFFGFSGILANKFSLVEKEDIEDVKMRIMVIDDTVNVVIQDVVSFFDFYAKNNPKTELKPIGIQDALHELRLGINLAPKSQEIDEPEEDEFDDNCNEDCIPGHHTCGK